MRRNRKVSLVQNIQRCSLGLYFRPFSAPKALGTSEGNFSSARGGQYEKLNPLKDSPILHILDVKIKFFHSRTWLNY